MSHVCIRIYNNGSAKYSVRDEEGLKSWFEYNKTFRFGNALFVDGIHLEDTGYLSGERLEFFSQYALSVKLPDPRVRQPKPIFEDGERTIRYADDSVLVSDYTASDAWKKNCAKKARAARKAKLAEVALEADSTIAGPGF